MFKQDFFCLSIWSIWELQQTWGVFSFEFLLVIYVKVFQTKYLFDVPSFLDKLDFCTLSELLPKTLPQSPLEQVEYHWNEEVICRVNPEGFTVPRAGAVEVGENGEEKPQKVMFFFGLIKREALVVEEAPEIPSGEKKEEKEGLGPGPEGELNPKPSLAKNKKTFDITSALEGFKKIVFQYDQYKEGMKANFNYLPWAALPLFVFPHQVRPERPQISRPMVLNSAKHQQQLEGEGGGGPTLGIFAQLAQKQGKTGGIFGGPRIAEIRKKYTWVNPELNKGSDGSTKAEGQGELTSEEEQKEQEEKNVPGMLEEGEGQKKVSTGKRKLRKSRKRGREEVKFGGHSRNVKTAVIPKRKKIGKLFWWRQSGAKFDLKGGKGNGEILKRDERNEQKWNATVNFMDILSPLCFTFYANFFFLNRTYAWNCTENYHMNQMFQCFIYLPLPFFFQVNSASRVYPTVIPVIK